MKIKIKSNYPSVSTINGNKMVVRVKPGTNIFEGKEAEFLYSLRNHFKLWIVEVLEEAKEEPEKETEEPKEEIENEIPEETIEKETEEPKEEIEESNEYVCEICGKVYKSKGFLERHMKKEHSE